jgi:hypothetical protein
MNSQLPMAAESMTCGGQSGAGTRRKPLPPGPVGTAEKPWLTLSTVLGCSPPFLGRPSREVSKPKALEFPLQRPASG